MQIIDDPGAVAEWFAPERPGPMLLAHLRAVPGAGRCRVDRWPDPRAVLVELPGGNLSLRGDPAAFQPADLAELVGLVEAPPEWLPALRRVDPDTAILRRIVAVLPDRAVVAGPAAESGPAPSGPAASTGPAAHSPAAPSGAPVSGPAATSGPATVRRLGPSDAVALSALDPSLAWIHETWGGAEQLARSGMSWAAFAGGRVVSVAVPFFVGELHEDIGVVTDPAHRRRGLSAACAAGLVADIRSRGRRPSWSTSTGNAASQAVAARLGFVPQREDVLYAVRMPAPED